MKVDVEVRKNPDIIITLSWDDAIDLAAYLSLCGTDTLPYRLKTMMSLTFNTHQLHKYTVIKEPHTGVCCEEYDD